MSTKTEEKTTPSGATKHPSAAAEPKDAAAKTTPVAAAKATPAAAATPKIDEEKIKMALHLIQQMNPAKPKDEEEEQKLKGLEVDDQFTMMRDAVLMF